MSVLWIGVAALAVGGTAAGMSASKTAGKGGGGMRDMKTEIAGLPFSDHRSEAQNMALSQMNLGNLYNADVMNAYGNTATGWRDQGKQTAGSLLKLFPRFSAAERQSTTSQRAGDAMDLMRLGPAFSQALSNASPGMASLQRIGADAGTQSDLLGSLNDSASFGSPIARALNEQAMSELALGGQLTPEEQANAAQSARAGWASRGLAFSNPAVGDEILQRDRAVRERMGQRRQFASSVDESMKRFGMGVEELNQRDLSTRASVAGASASPIMQLFGQRSVASMNPILGAFSATPTPSMTSGIMSQAPSIFEGAQALQPIYNYGADLYNTNFNALEARALNKSNAMSALSGGLFGMAGGLAKGGAA